MRKKKQKTVHTTITIESTTKFPLTKPVVDKDNITAVLPSVISKISGIIAQ